MTHLSYFEGFKRNVDRILYDRNFYNFVVDMLNSQGTDVKNFEYSERNARYINCNFKTDVFEKYFECAGYFVSKNIFF